MVLWVVPCVVLIPVGVLLLDHSYIPLGLGTWNGIVGMGCLIYSYAKRSLAESQILQGKSMAGFWVSFTSTEQGLAIVLSLIVYMSGVSALCKQYFFPGTAAHTRQHK